jgi:hypothetical protein
MIHMLKARGALNEADAGGPGAAGGLAAQGIPPHVLELLPEPVARENVLLPLDFDGETLTCASDRPDDIALADKLRFILNKNIRLVPAPREALLREINRHYGPATTESVDSMLSEFTDTAIDFTQTEYERDEDAPRVTGPPPRVRSKGGLGRRWGGGSSSSRKG